MNGPYGLLWLTYEYTKYSLVKYTYAEAFLLHPRYQHDTGT
jgi:hypothetical protein